MCEILKAQKKIQTKSKSPYPTSTGSSAGIKTSPQPSQLPLVIRPSASTLHRESYLGSSQPPALKNQAQVSIAQNVDETNRTHIHTHIRHETGEDFGEIIKFYVLCYFNTLFYALLIRITGRDVHQHR